MTNKTISMNEALFEYCLRIGDTSLIASHRISEWCGHGPILEEDIALANVALDLIGQARIILSYAGKIEGKNRSEDDLAYLRDARQFRNFLLAEQPNGDFAQTVVRQYLLSVFNLHLYAALKKSKDSDLAGFAEKSLKEVTYHVRHFADWMLRLGDGTDESHQRLQNAVNELWYFVDDMFQSDEVDDLSVQEGIGADLSEIRKLWDKDVNDIMTRAKLETPQLNNTLRQGSRKGNHTEHLGYILAEMQFLPRAYPDAKW